MCSIRDEDDVSRIASLNIGVCVYVLNVRRVFWLEYCLFLGPKTQYLEQTGCGFLEFLVFSVQSIFLGFCYECNL